MYTWHLAVGGRRWRDGRRLALAADVRLCLIDASNETHDSVRISVLLLRAKAAHEARGKRREKEQTPKIGAKLAAVHSRNAKTQKTPSDFGHPF